MKAIRWGGFVAFIAIVAVLVVSVLLFAEPIVKNILESQLTELNKAKVDVAKVNIDYSSFAIGVTDIHVTDPEQPMVNMLEVGKANFAISFADLFFRKVIINDMSLNAIKLDTPRKVSGQIIKQVETVKESEEEEAFEFPDIGLPDVSDILKMEPLTADKLLPELNDDYKKTRESWKDIKDDVNNKQRWDDYDVRYSNLRKDFKGSYAEKLRAIKSAKKLSADLKSEAEKIKQARKTFNADIERLNDKFEIAKRSPRDDIRRIREKYNLDQFDASNITQLLFGEQTAEWLRFAQTWYARIQPYLNDDEEEEQVKIDRIVGENIKFNELDPKPSFYIKNASIDAVTSRGQFEGVITHVSSNQSINKKPMRFDVSGVNLTNRDKENIAGEFNYINKSKGSSQVAYSMSRYQLNDFQVSKSASLPLSIEKSLMDVSVDLHLQKGVLSGDAVLNFKDAVFGSKKTDKGSSLSRMVASSFEDIHEFYIKTKFNGAIDDLQFKLRSDLDNRVGDQLKVQFRDRKQRFENDLKARIDEKVKEPMAKLEAKREELNQLKADVDAKEQEIKQKLAFLKDQIKSEADLKKQELKAKTDAKLDKKKDKLKSKFKSLFK